MTTLLKRLSLNLERKVTNSSMDESANPSRGLAASHSFNDFSMHTQQDSKFRPCRRPFRARCGNLFFDPCKILVGMKAKVPTTLPYAVDDHHETHMSPTQPIDMRESATKAPARPSPFTPGSAPAGKLLYFLFCRLGTNFLTQYQLFYRYGTHRNDERVENSTHLCCKHSLAKPFQWRDTKVIS
jgi:hypothetical protein